MQNNRSDSPLSSTVAKCTWCPGVIGSRTQSIIPPLRNRNFHCSPASGILQALVEPICSMSLKTSLCGCSCILVLNIQQSIEAVARGLGLFRFIFLISEHYLIPWYFPVFYHDPTYCAYARLSADLINECEIISFRTFCTKHRGFGLNRRP